MNLSDEEKKNWNVFRGTNPKNKHCIDKPVRTRSILVDEELWDFSVCVIKTEGKNNRNSFVINQLIKEYVEEHKVEIIKKQ